VKYSCVLINPAPLQLNYAVGADAVVVPLISSSGQPFQTVTVSWTPITEAGGGFPADPLGGCPSAAGALYPVAGGGAWTCKYPMLRAEMVRTTSLSRSSLLTGNRVNFLEPTTSGSGAASAAQTGKVVPAKCVSGAKPTCEVVFNGFSGGKYYMHLGALYGATNVTITATDASGPVGLEGAQAVIDATGNAHGILRRVLVAVDLSDSNSTRLASAALMVGDTVCKRFSVAKNFFNIASDLPGGNGNPLCEAADIAPPPADPPPSASCSKPKDVVLTLDESSSMQNRWNRGLSREDELKKLSVEFVQSITKKGGMRVGVVSFNANAKIEEPLTNNYSAVISAIKGMRWSGGTHYDEGLAMTQNAFKASRGLGIPRVMVFISDGKPNGSASYQEILNTTSTMKKDGILIYTIGIYPGDENTGILQRMATSKGTYTEANTAEQMQSFFKKIAGEISC
ncbi:MAG TPA: vWA domain-containing protein, partial [Candidatus Saccharimonadales bacterium]|nr:vWA domain-containing protein [Candidatus Saccharimonadales bacterium]